MTICSWNVNGIRSVVSKDALSALVGQYDILCWQELKAQADQIPDIFDGYHGALNCAQKPGYSGVAVNSRQPPDQVIAQLGQPRFDVEGRYLELHFPGFILINIYLPHGNRDQRDLEYKLACYRLFRNHLKTLADKKVMIVGDFNVAHTELDLARPQQNQDNIMFTAAERRQLDEIEGLGYVDALRQRHPGEPGLYTWWPWIGDARARNVGWRLDYSFVSPALAASIKNAAILKDTTGSDHCPISLELDL